MNSEVSVTRMQVSVSSSTELKSMGCVWLVNGWLR